MLKLPVTNSESTGRMFMSFVLYTNLFVFAVLYEWQRTCVSLSCHVYKIFCLVTLLFNAIVTMYHNAPISREYHAQLNKHIFKIIMIEHNFEQPSRDNIRKYLAERNYKYVTSNQWDDIYMVI